MLFSEWKKQLKEDIRQDWNYIKEAEQIWDWLFDSEEGLQFLKNERILKIYEFTESILKKVFNIPEENKNQLLLFDPKDKKLNSFNLKFEYNKRYRGMFKPPSYIFINNEELYIRIDENNIIKNKNYYWAKSTFIHEYKHFINFNRYKGGWDKYEKQREYDPTKISPQEKYETSIQEYDSYFTDFVYRLNKEIHDRYYKVGKKDNPRDYKYEKNKKSLKRYFKTYNNFINDFIMKEPVFSHKTQVRILLHRFRKKFLKRLYPFYLKWKREYLL